MTEEEKSGLQSEVSPGVFKAWPSQATQDTDWGWYHTATQEGHLVATLFLKPPVLKRVLLEDTKGSSKLHQSKQTYYSVSGNRGKSVQDIISGLTVKIKSRRPKKLGKEKPITYTVKPDFPGGKTVSLSLTPNWIRPYRAILTVTSGGISEHIRDFHGVSRTIYTADGSQSPGHWPLHNSDDPSARSAWLEALAKVHCQSLYPEQVNKLAADFVAWVPDLSKGQDAGSQVVTVVNNEGTVTAASLALSIDLPGFEHAGEVPILNAGRGHRW